MSIKFLRSPKASPFLQRTFEIVGWVIAAFTLAQILLSFRDYRLLAYLNHHANELDAYQLQRLSEEVTRHPFSLLQAMRNIFTCVSSALFAFLIGAVFRMIHLSDSLQTKRAEKLARLTCASYLILGIGNLVSWAQWTAIAFKIEFIESQFSTWETHFIWGFSSLMVGLNNMVPFLYAAGIFAVFSHFSGLVTFESEVV